MFEVEVKTGNGTKTIVVANYQPEAFVDNDIAVVPLRFDKVGWNYITIDLKQLCQRLFASNYQETLRIEIHASCSLRSVFFADKLIAEHELPSELKLTQ